MKKVFILISCSLVLAGVIAIKAINNKSVDKAEHNREYIVREAKWGMSEEDVIKVEGRQPDETLQGELTYKNVNVNGFDANLTYSFKNNKLNLIKFITTEKHKNKTDYLNDYKRLKNIYTDTYGAAKFDKSVWKEGVSESHDIKVKAECISKQELFYFCIWSTDNMGVMIKLEGDSGEIHTIVSINYDI